MNLLVVIIVIINRKKKITLGDPSRRIVGGGWKSVLLNRKKLCRSVCNPSWRGAAAASSISHGMLSVRWRRMVGGLSWTGGQTFGQQYVWCFVLALGNWKYKKGKRGRKLFAEELWRFGEINCCVKDFWWAMMGMFYFYFRWSLTIPSIWSQLLKYLFYIPSSGVTSALGVRLGHTHFCFFMTQCHRWWRYLLSCLSLLKCGGRRLSTLHTKTNIFV